ncbi:MAG TPA: hypothetical protein VGG90_00070 [Candidatus Dormibacteraeota bacterium]|jgi:hypothetical protein
METERFADLAASGLLEKVERIVVDGHRRLVQAEGKEWTPPAAYRWLRYEDPEPVGRLAEGVRKLRERDVKFDAEAVEKACALASQKGFLN